MSDNLPHDLDEGVWKFLKFHQLDPREVGTFSPAMRIPERVGCGGKMEWIAYRSTKWENRSHNYIHEHGGGVHIYGGGGTLRTPQFICKVQTLVRLGHCLELGFCNEEGESVEMKTTRPQPELYCIPSGKALLIVDGKRRIEALIWGGGLHVTERGIVG